MYKAFFVEDETAVRDMMIHSVNWAEYGIEFCGTAENGESALPAIIQSEPDILITDIKMPFMNGLELIRLARQTFPDISAIILSGYSDFDYMQEAIHLGVTDYILKPITPVKLMKALTRAVQQIDGRRDQARVDAIVSGVEQRSFRDGMSSMVESAAGIPVDRERLHGFLSTGSEADVQAFASEMALQCRKSGASAYFMYDVVSTAADVARKMGMDPQFFRRYSVMAEQLEGDAGCEGLFSDLFREIIRLRDSASDTKTRLIKAARDYLDVNYMRESLSLSEVAAHIGITSNYLSALFSRETGETFSEYLNRIRIRAATRLLKNSGLSINEIASQTGYSDAVYFSKVFKRLMGMSPRAYKQIK